MAVRKEEEERGGENTVSGLWIRLTNNGMECHCDRGQVRDEGGREGKGARSVVARYVWVNSFCEELQCVTLMNSLYYIFVFNSIFQ